MFPKEDHVKINAFFVISREELEVFIKQLDPFIERIEKNENTYLQKKLRKLKILREIGSENWEKTEDIYRKVTRNKGYKVAGKNGTKKTFDRDLIELKLEGYIHLKKRKGRWQALREDSKIYEIEE